MNVTVDKPKDIDALHDDLRALAKKHGLEMSVLTFCAGTTVGALQTVDLPTTDVMHGLARRGVMVKGVQDVAAHIKKELVELMDDLQVPEEASEAIITAIENSDSFSPVNQSIH